MSLRESVHAIACASDSMTVAVSLGCHIMGLSSEVLLLNLLSFLAFATSS